MLFFCLLFCALFTAWRVVFWAALLICLLLQMQLLGKYDIILILVFNLIFFKSKCQNSFQKKKCVPSLSSRISNIGHIKTNFEDTLISVEESFDH